MLFTRSLIGQNFALIWLGESAILQASVWKPVSGLQIIDCRKASCFGCFVISWLVNKALNLVTTVTQFIFLIVPITIGLLWYVDIITMDATGVRYRHDRLSWKPYLQCVTYNGFTKRLTVQVVVDPSLGCPVTHPDLGLLGHAGTRIWNSLKDFSAIWASWRRIIRHWTQ